MNICWNQKKYYLHKGFIATVLFTALLFSCALLTTNIGVSLTHPVKSYLNELAGILFGLSVGLSLTLLICSYVILPVDQKLNASLKTATVLLTQEGIDSVHVKFSSVYYKTKHGTFVFPNDNYPAPIVMTKETVYGTPDKEIFTFDSAVSTLTSLAQCVIRHYHTQLELQTKRADNLATWTNTRVHPFLQIFCHGKTNSKTYQTCLTLLVLLAAAALVSVSKRQPTNL
jgi:hypothetical protein